MDMRAPELERTVCEIVFAGDRVPVPLDLTSWMKLAATLEQCCPDPHWLVRCFQCTPPLPPRSIFVWLLTISALGKDAYIEAEVECCTEEMPSKTMCRSRYQSSVSVRVAQKRYPGKIIILRGEVSREGSDVCTTEGLAIDIIQKLGLEHPKTE